MADRSTRVVVSTEPAEYLYNGCSSPLFLIQLLARLTTLDMAAKKGGSKAPQTADAPTDSLIKWMKRLVFVAFLYSVCKILDRVKVRLLSLHARPGVPTRIFRTGGMSSLLNTSTPSRKQR